MCSIITLDDDEVEYSFPPEVAISAIGERSETSIIDKLLRYGALRRLVRESRPDLVLALPEDIGVFVIPSLAATGIPVVVSERNDPRTMPWKLATRILRRLVYPFAAGFVFQTKGAASYFPRAIQDRGIVLPNPLDLERLPEAHVGERRKEVVAAGRLDKQKNFSLMIRAFARFHQTHPDYVLTIYGEGRERGRLESLANSLFEPGIVTLPGRSDALLREINGAAMFVLSSDYEGMPNVVIEAMALGMPVVSTDCPSGGSAYLIDSGRNGVLVPVGDVEGLGNAMRHVADDPTYAKGLGENALTIIRRLDAAVVVSRWSEYLNDVIER